LLQKNLDESALHGRPGIGLVAPQIGIAKNMAIIRIKDESTGKNINIDLVNAKIEEKYDLSIFNNEGCLSLPGEKYNTKRYNEIHVTNDVEPKKFIATGLLAVAIQHELDHTLGVILSDIGVLNAPKKNKTRPNDLCPCGSGKKFKKCCKK
jgi:peptide deformylase